MFRLEVEPIDCRVQLLRKKTPFEISAESHASLTVPNKSLDYRFFNIGLGQSRHHRVA